MNEKHDPIDKHLYALLSKESYNDHVLHKSVNIDGTDYQVIDTVNHSKSGFEATAYQRADGDVIIAYRGTEATKFGLQMEPQKDLGSDTEMVQHQTNAQQPDAEAFTQRILARVQASHPNWDLGQHVHVTGHSLGATHAEIEAARHHLGGAGFNAYGAADLKYSVPEGQPADAPAFVGYARATDVVSSASRHYGSMHIYANEEDIASLRAGHYLDPSSAGLLTNPMLAASVYAHFVNNFAPDPGKGESIMTAANEARYLEHKTAIDHYRSDVMTDRIGLHTLLDQNKTYDPVSQIEQKLNQISAQLHLAGQTTELGASLTARGIHSGGERVQADAEAFSRQTQTGGQAVQTIADNVAQTGHTIAAAAPGIGLGLELEARATGFVAGHAADGMSSTARAAGQAIRGAADAISRQTQAAGEAAHGWAASASQRVHQLEQTTEQAAHEISQQAQQAGAAARHAAGQAYETMTHPDTWLKNTPAPAYAAAPHATPAPTASTAPASIPENLRDFRHPSHPLHSNYQDTLVQVHAMEDKGKMAHGGHSEQLASALTDAMHKEHFGPLARIEMRGPNHALQAVAHQSRPSVNAPEKHVSVDVNNAMSHTIEQHSQNWSQRVMPDLNQPAHQRDSSRAPLSMHDPRNPDNRDHGLYNELHRRIPDASELRLLQFTDACHANKITAGNLATIQWNGSGEKIGFLGSSPLSTPCIVDLTKPAPQPQQSIQNIQQYDHQQAQTMSQIQWQNTQPNQQGPMR